MHTSNWYGNYCDILLSVEARIRFRPHHLMKELFSSHVSWHSNKQIVITALMLNS